MAIDQLTPPETSIAVDARRHARRGLLLVAFAVWNAWLWGTRAYNMFTSGEDRTVAFIAVHLVLYGVSLGFAAAFGLMGWRMRAEAKAAAEGSA